MKMLPRISDEDESYELYDEFDDDDEKDEEEEEAERLKEIESELYSYIHYGSQTDLETETVDPTFWRSLEKDNSAVNRPLMRLKVKEDKKSAEDPILTKTFKCGNCSLVGHLSRDCRQMKPPVCYLCGILGHKSHECPDSICFNCECPGHFTRDCNACKRPYNAHCSRCDMKGHMYHECPDLWRRYHATTREGPIMKTPSRCNPRVYCSNCGLVGHFAYDCYNLAMYRFIKPSYPFIVSYKKNFVSRKNFKKKEKRYMKFMFENDEIPVKKPKIKDKAKIVKKKISKKKKKNNQIGKKVQISNIVKKRLKTRKRKNKLGYKKFFQFFLTSVSLNICRAFSVSNITRV
ncbi:zinc finger CCHC domain-containing protein 7-like [Octopus sinensis]|uniref:Zinc finger CCHC domain-containing protein 7 n=1 Tax=Octopus sinensis TaxID=2607531 RepID=A0A7E6FAT2_9MOLL|nr:zinc finger CCHC domain-containing protein 7-like [Octopus sinensis]